MYFSKNMKESCKPKELFTNDVPIFDSFHNLNFTDKKYRCLINVHNYCKKIDYGKFNGHLRYIFIFETHNKIFI